MGGFSSSAFSVLAFSVAAFSFDAVTPPAAVTPEQPKYYSVDNGAAQRAHRRQQLEEDEVMLAVIQQFVLET
jgi:hypothetical protein